MKRIIGTAMVLTWAGAAALAHEHWVDVEDYYPAAGKSVKVHVCSGHAFPESSTVLKERVLRGTRVIAPGGKASDYQASEAGKKRTARIELGEAGVHLVLFELGPPQMKEPMYQAKAIVIAGDGDDEAKYAVGHGLEIVPMDKLSGLSKGGKLSLAVLYNGTRIAARITIEPEQGKSSVLSTTAKRAAEFKVPGEGRYLVTTSHKGKTCSLTFAVGGEGGKK